MDSDYVYYQRRNATISLPKFEYQMYINRDPRTSSNGVANTYYSELRIWSYARSTQEIKDF